MKGPGHLWLCSFGQPGKAREELRGRAESTRQAVRHLEVGGVGVWEAYRQVKANQGAPGVDGCSIEDFEKDLKRNLYKIWNRSVSCEAAMDLPVRVRPG